MKTQNTGTLITMSYQVFANGRREYVTTNAGKAADVAVAWKNQGHAPKAWRVTAPESGPVQMREVEVTTKAKTAKALAKK